MNNELVLVFDEHPLIRYAVTGLIKKIGGQTLDTGCRTKTLTLISSYNPDLIILDILMHECLGLNYIKKIMKMAPDSKILVFSSLQPHFFIKECLALGVHGYVHKKDDIASLVGAIDAVISGHCCFPNIDLKADAPEMPLGWFYHEK